MFRDYLLVIDPDHRARRALVSRLGASHPILVAGDADGACDRIRRCGPPRAIVAGVDLEALPGGGGALLEQLAKTCPGTLVIRLAKGGAPAASDDAPARIVWAADLDGVEVAIASRAPRPTLRSQPSGGLATAR